MKIFNKVRGTMKNVPNVEVNADTVYVRSNIVRIDSERFNGWQYDEIQYTLREYVENLAEKQLLDRLIIDNLNMQMQLDAIIESSLEV
jgi:hypothetical protein